jgi:protein-tyrosine phosphatase
MSKQAKDAGTGKQRVGVVFVCTGNICRSPLAEGVFRHLATERGLAGRLEIDSAGISDYHEGDPPDARTNAVARRRGIELTGKSRPLVRSDLDRFDYIIVMDEENRQGVDRLARGATPSGRVHFLREFDPEAGNQLAVPDPYYGGPSGFEHVHDLVERACRHLLDSIAQEQGW